MSFAPNLIALGEYLAGKFDNQEQALADSAWFVHLHLWQRPVDLFTEDSITLFAEQANIVNLDHPYRQRIMRLMSGRSPDAPLQLQYYMFKDPSAFSGAGRNPALLKTLTVDQLDLLPGCILTVTETLAANSYQFTATQPPNTRCCFTYLNQTVQVSLGFVATAVEFHSYDKGIDSDTGKATWGAILGPYRYTKREQY
ncbi:MULTISPECIES: chromophore lyase CpcT/CpeT [unclassified Nodularia (in: cyanobacteria)]|uniref:chromophore lyase CpcT/CpeT n=1 Tax=unclassified Nodularia (in: cyanobacteria) TaxID=2656917 RepID=UPI001882D83B|nr:MULTISPECIES: chromophore lyase CpcT/CpeT [unclassified Nodularia (in: cyanobacteria)]MBE9198837.1 chromophore lyase CpcT/CpeT [Nodularia sp. LEGE 06071]MCC2692991.1 chromophore lyase CpcT/CpeT [Nodularia sp. LEGE 04288]